MTQRDLNEMGWIGAIEGMERSTAKADSDAPEWSMRALGFLELFIQAHRSTFIAPELRLWCEDRGLDPPSSTRAWGTVMRMAVKRGLIAPAGYSQYGDEVTHTRPVRVWRATGGKP